MKMTRRSAAALASLALVLALAGSLLAGPGFRVPGGRGITIPSRAPLWVPPTAGGQAATTAPAPAPVAPDAPTLTVAGVTTDTISLTCTTPTGATSFEWDVAEDSGFSAGRMVLTATTTTAAALSVTGQPAGVALYVRARAVGAGGTSASSVAVNGTLVTRTLDCSATMVNELGNHGANYVAAASNNVWHATVGGNATQTTDSAAPTASTTGLVFASGDLMTFPTYAGFSSLATHTIVVSAMLVAHTGTYSFFTEASTDPPRVTTGFSNSPSKAYALYSGNAFEPNKGASFYDGAQHVMAYQLKIGSTFYVWDNGVAVGTTGGNGITAATPSAWIVGNYSSGIFPVGSSNTVKWVRYFQGQALSSAEVASTPLWLDAPPRGPDLAAATTITTTSFVASWTALGGVASYRLTVDDDPAFGSPVSGYNERIVSSAGGTTVSGLTTGTAYYWTVRSVGAGGIGPRGTATSTTTL